MRPSLDSFAARLIDWRCSQVRSWSPSTSRTSWELGQAALRSHRGAELPTWLNSVPFAGAALAAALAAEVARRRLAWWALAAVLLFFSLDELALVHEEIIECLTYESGGEPWFGPLFYTPIAAACLLAFAVAARDARHARSVRLFPAGFACLGVALVLDGAAARYMDEPWLWHPSVVVEESLELLGPVLLAAVAVAVWEKEAASAAAVVRG